MSETRRSSRASSPLRPLSLLCLCGLAAATLAWAACIVQPFDADCPDDAGCDDCLGRSGCGWCDAPVGAGSCVPGSSLGPADQEACGLTSWHYGSCDDAVCDDSCSSARNGSCDEPVPCDRGTDCTDCGS